MRVQVLRADRDCVALPLTEEGGEARAIVWPGVGARHRSMHYIALPAGGRTVPHRHAASEAVYYVIRGEGAVEDLDAGSLHRVHAGSIALITPGNAYRIVAAARTDLTCVGGPCPPDPALYASAATEGQA
ncbi:MAG: cupin domain-containing protein [Armatimonadota bacterium]